MSEKEQKKNKPDDEQSDSPKEEPPRHDLSPGDSEDRCLLSPPPSAGAEALPIAGGSRSSRRTRGITGMFRMISPFKGDTDPKKPKKTKKPKKESSFTKAKDAFRRTFRKSDTHIQTAEPESLEKRPRKVSDPTHFVTEAEPQTGSEHKKSFFGSFSASTSKETTKTKDEPKTKAPKTKKGSKETAVEPEGKETKPGPAVQKKALSPRPSNQPSIGAVSVGFFNEALLPSESSGVPTESTSVDTQDVKSGSSFSPDSFVKRPSTKRRRAKETDDESSLSD